LGFGIEDDPQSRNEEDQHGVKKGPSLSGFSDHIAEHEDEGHRDEKNGEILDEVRRECRVFERLGGIGVEKAPAVGTELLDGDL
jgi:hypothetical protein